MSNFKTLGVLAIAGALLIGKPTNAQSQAIQRMISYQGTVSSSDGAIPNGNASIKVTFYTDSFGSTPVWFGTYPVIIHGGIFDIILGSGNYPLPSSTVMDRPIWVGVNINGTGEAKPLSQLTASPYSLNVPDSSITANKIGADYVSSISVNGEKVTGNGTALNIAGGEGMALNFDQTTQTIYLSQDKLGMGTGNVKGSDPLSILDRIALTDNTNSSYSNLLGTSGNKVLHGNAPPTYSVVDLAADVGTTILLPANGGTGSSSGAWSLAGNSLGTTEFLGGTDATSHPLVIKVGNTTVASFRSGGFLGINDPTNSVQNNIGTVVAGGTAHQINNGHKYCIIGGGSTNEMIDEGSDYASILGGSTGLMGYIGNTSGPENNSVLVGGDQNGVHTDHSFLGGGFQNRIGYLYDPTAHGGSGPKSSLGIVANYSTLGGGAGNNINAGFSTIGGGQNNMVGFVDESVLTGGYPSAPTISSTYSFIGGGYDNVSSGYACVIGGGYQNTMNGWLATISGGSFNQVIHTAGSPIGYGATISGGQGNIVSGALFGSIGGGLANQVAGTGYGAAIPGGYGLKANLIAQTIIGRNNLAPLGTTNIYPIPFTTFSISNNDDREFIIGNGTLDPVTFLPIPSNAFEVSYNGHSIVYDKNGPSHIVGGRAPIRGATYEDNVNYAWGVVGGGALTNDFGVLSVAGPFVLPSVTTYIVTLNLQKPDGTLLTLSEGSVTVTLVSSDGACIFVSATPLSSTAVDGFGHNQFTVALTQQIIDPMESQHLKCVSADASFMFQVFGRP